jgi:hypothetical protein
MKTTLSNIFFTAIALLFCSTLWGQNYKIAVDSFYMDETDQTARLAKLKDQNNKVCAIVKIETLLSLNFFTFNTGTIGVVKTEQQKGEIWLYLPVGTRRLTISHEHHGIIRDYPFGEALKEATVYILKLKSVVILKIDASFPATIEINGKNVGISPQTVDNLPLGRTEVIFRREGYETLTKTITLVKGYQEIYGDLIKEIPKTATLKIDATFPAAIEINGKNVGTSPKTIDNLLLGKTEVIFRREGYAPLTKTINLVRGNNELYGYLVKEFPKTATLRVDANVIATIGINGKNVGASPKTVQDLPLGRTQVTFDAYGYKTLEKTINLVQGYNEIHGDLKRGKITEPKFFIEYVYSKTAPIGLFLGYCKQFGGYLQFKTGTDVGLAFNGLSGKNNIEPEAFPMLISVKRNTLVWHLQQALWYVSFMDVICMPE